MNLKHFEKKLILLPLFAVTCLFSYADTFIVTTNADSGPGTLREAIMLANANGIGVMDSIIFNIADVSEQGRTIALKSELPELTSNIIIDGTTQPGTKFGVSDAKVKLTVSLLATVQFEAGLKILKADNIKVFGVFFYRIICPVLNNSIAIMLSHNKNITIGEPGKGNYFSENGFAIALYRYYVPTQKGYIESIKIQSNIMGLNSDGSRGAFNYNSLYLWNAVNPIIGGNTESEGNHLYDLNIGSDTAIKQNICLIKNNSFGSNFSKTSSSRCEGIRVGARENSNFSDVIIQNNLFENFKLYLSLNWSLVQINRISGYIDIKSNKFNTLLSSTNSESNTADCITINDCEKGIIGGPNPEDANYISKGIVNGINITNNNNIKISRNSIYCNGKGITATSSKVVIPEVKVMNENGTNFISGTATPNCKIEVFQTPQCDGCENGKIFMGETMSDNAGNWGFSGGYTSAVTATATTADSITGEFASPLFTQATDIKNPTCNHNNGSITGTKFIAGTKYYWIKHSNGNKDTVYNQLDLINLGPGMYEFIVEQTKFCKISDTITLAGQDALLTIQNMTVLHPSCDKTNGSIKNLTAQNNNYKTYWLSAARDTVSKNFELLNAAPGNYKLFVSDISTGCSDSSQWIVLVNQPGPKIDLNGSIILADTCSMQKGSIAGISILSGTGSMPFSYQWLDGNNNVVSTKQNLTDAGEGSYRLIITDANMCADTSNILIITNISGQLPDPVYSDQTIRSNTSTVLTVMNPQQGTYYLYDHLLSATSLDQNSTGNFTTSVLTQNKTYYIELVSSICKSNRAEVKVFVYDKTVIYVPTAFTPNNDQKNDIIKPIAYGPAKLEYFRIFNRWGQLIFESKDFVTGWDGKINGAAQPASNFTWALKAKDEITGEVFTMFGAFLLIR